MTQQKLGRRIVTRIDRVPRDRFEKLMQVTTGNACDAMDRFGAMDYRIKPVHPSMKCVGTAVTVKARPCDNLIIYKALEVAEPGDVIVIGLGGFTGNAVWGDITSLIGRKKNLAGMVTDGLVRDTPGIEEVGLPVFAMGAVPSSPFKDGQGEVNVPITCGGITVMPGDIVLGDADGVAVVPAAHIDAVTRRALEIVAEEERKIAAIEAGHLIPDWVDPKLRELGYELDR